MGVGSDLLQDYTGLIVDKCHCPPPEWRPTFNIINLIYCIIICVLKIYKNDAIANEDIYYCYCRLVWMQ